MSGDSRCRGRGGKLVGEVGGGTIGGGGGGTMSGVEDVRGGRGLDGGQGGAERVF